MSDAALPAARSVLVTGAGRGIGRAIAFDLARSTDVALVLVSKTARCEATAAACEMLRSGSAVARRWDIATKGAERNAAISALASADGPTALVHAAAVLGPTGPFAATDPDAWWTAMETNLGATVRLVRSVLPRMLADRAGRIVLFAGGGAAYGYPGFSSYGVAKAALVRFVETLAMELGDAGVVITIVAPGANETDMLAEVRQAGGEVRTTVSIEEPCTLVRRLLAEDTRGLHGRFVHVRDAWTADSALGLGPDHWKLRRVE